MPIYTRTGDKGTTGLFNGRRVAKDSLVIEAIGSVDELNAVIGLALARIKNKELRIKNNMQEIQGDLFSVGASLANPKSKTLVDFEKRAKEIEKQIDEMTKKLPKLMNFILPGGSETGASLHLARTVCRRAERQIVALSKKEKVSSSVLIYINRLSDLLFTMARFVNLAEKKKEVVWKNG